jgi:hypothetical protein
MRLWRPAPLIPPTRRSLSAPFFRQARARLACFNPGFEQPEERWAIQLRGWRCLHERRISFRPRIVRVFDYLAGRSVEPITGSLKHKEESMRQCLSRMLQ